MIPSGNTRMRHQQFGRQIIQAATGNLGLASILVAEATIMRNCIRAAIEAEYTDIPIEGNSKILIQAIQGHI